MSHHKLGGEQKILEDWESTGKFTIKNYYLKNYKNKQKSLIHQIFLGSMIKKFFQPHMFQAMLESFLMHHQPTIAWPCGIIFFLQIMFLFSPKWLFFHAKLTTIRMILIF